MIMPSHSISRYLLRLALVVFLFSITTHYARAAATEDASAAQKYMNLTKIMSPEELKTLDRHIASHYTACFAFYGILYTLSKNSNAPKEMVDKFKEARNVAAYHEATWGTLGGLDTKTLNALFDDDANHMAKQLKGNGNKAPLIIKYSHICKNLLEHSALPLIGWVTFTSPRSQDKDPILRGESR
jgi:hypothetical protein